MMITSHTSKEGQMRRHLGLPTWDKRLMGQKCDHQWLFIVLLTSMNSNRFYMWFVISVSISLLMCSALCWCDENLPAPTPLCWCYEGLSLELAPLCWCDEDLPAPLCWCDEAFFISVNISVLMSRGFVISITISMLMWWGFVISISVLMYWGQRCK